MLEPQPACAVAFRSPPARAQPTEGSGQLVPQGARLPALLRRGANGGANKPGYRGGVSRSLNARAGIRTRTGLPPRDFKGLEPLGTWGSVEGGAGGKPRETPWNPGAFGANGGANALWRARAIGPEGGRLGGLPPTTKRGWRRQNGEREPRTGGSRVCCGGVNLCGLRRSAGPG